MPPFPVTVTVSTTGLPAIEGIRLDVSTVDVVAEVIVSSNGVDALPT
jgi:hypothetical protein